MIALVNTTWDIRESVLFQQVLKTYPTHHFWMITAHVSLGDMEKQWKLFTKQMIRTHQLLPSLEQKPAAPTQLLTGLEAELRNLNIIYTSCQHIIQAATQLLWKEPTFDEIPVSTKHIKITLLSFLGDALSWLTGTATTKDVDAIKTRINQLISTQQKQQEIPVHIISILNFTIHATQVNRHHINILMYMTEKTQQMHNNTAQYHMFPLQQHQLPSDPSWPTLHNTTCSLYNSISYHQIHLGQPPGFPTLYDRNCLSHHGLYQCSYYRNTLDAHPTCLRSEGDTEANWGNTAFYDAPIHFL